MPSLLSSLSKVSPSCTVSDTGYRLQASRFTFDGRRAGTSCQWEKPCMSPLLVRRSRFHGCRPQAGVGDPLYGVGPVVYEAEGAERVQDAELVLRRDGKSHLGTEMGFQPRFEIGGHDLRVVVGSE